MSNPFERFLSKEDLLHRAVVEFIKLQHPYAIVAHPPNEGRRSAFERYKAKILGISSGLPDLMIFNPIGSYAGLAIELKIKPNRMTDFQIKWHENLFKCRWQCACIYNLDDAMQLINDYFKPNKSKHGTTTLN